MDILKHFIGFFIKLAFAFFLAAFVWLIVSIFYPSLSIRTLFEKGSTTSSTTNQGWLPSPKKFPSLLGKKAETPGENTNLFVAGPPFDGYGINGTIDNGQYKYVSYQYITYDSYGRAIITSENSAPRIASTTPPVNVPASSTPQGGARNLTIRNLSIYEGGHVYTGLSFVGEAKSTMFRDGKFPIVMVDQKGRMVGISAAIATTNWTVPGWTRFETKITYVLPNNVPCTMVFEEALTQNEKLTRQPLRIPMPMRCN